MLLKPTIKVTGGQKIPFHSLAGSVEFKSVKFTYPTRPDHIVLNDFNLEIPAGRIVALVGLSGSGQLLCCVCCFLWLYFLFAFADWEQNSAEIVINNTVKLFFNCNNQHFGNLKP